MRLTLILSVFAMLLTSCCKEPSTPAKVETPEFRWKIDSVDYQPCEPYYGGAFEPYYVYSSYYAEYQSWEVQMRFNYADNTYCLSGLSILVPENYLGLVEINDTLPELFLYIINDSISLTEYIIDTHDSFNRLEITKNIGSQWSDNYWISGTFQFRAIDTSNTTNDTLIITDGYFNHDLSC